MTHHHHHHPPLLLPSFPQASFIPPPPLHAFICVHTCGRALPVAMCLQCFRCPTFFVRYTHARARSDGAGGADIISKVPHCRAEVHLHAAVWVGMGGWGERAGCLMDGCCTCPRRVWCDIHTYSPKACLNSRSSPLALCDVTDPTSRELGELICLLTRCELVMGLGFGIWGSCDWIHPPWRKVVSLMVCVLGCSRTWANPIEYGWSFSICHRASGRTHPSGTG